MLQITFLLLIFFCSSGTKSKALAYFRDQPADASDVVVREGELNIKVTVIDGKVN
jgi:hypothetical protein